MNEDYPSDEFPCEEDQGARRRQQDVMFKRLQDLIEADPDRVAVGLADLSLSILAQQYPPQLSGKDKKKIKENYSGATDSLITERAMDKQGVFLAVALAVQTGRIAIDYFPDSNCKAAIDNDDAQGDKALVQLHSALKSIFLNATSAGASPFGTMTTMMLISASLGARNGVHWSAIVRPLLDTIDLVMMENSEPSQEDLEESAIKFIMAQMSISRAQAKRYLKMGKVKDSDLFRD